MTEHIDRSDDVEITSIEGNPTPEERVAAERALRRLIEREHRDRAVSLWRRAGRAQGRRLGTLDYMDRFAAEEAWRLSARFAFGGREYQGRNGRGDTK
ncbi:MAG: hypothetical protein ACRDKZ_00780 [Actinomycetota bacterium]